LYPDGRKDTTLSIQVGNFLTFKGGIVDTVVRDRDGKVIHDSKSERVKERLQFAALAAEVTPYDLLAKALLKSYGAAVGDPDNELIHLYEIRDSLCAHFKNGGEVRRILNVSKTRWDRFGILANQEPLTQGRHRGQKVGKLRSSTKDELDEARSFATHLIHAYLLYSKEMLLNKKA
jgi:hypothetical protein